MFDIKEGLNNLKSYIKIAPEKPGVYRMIDKDGVVLYVGKARNIRKRIISYSHINKLPKRLQQMVSRIAKMEFVVVENEARALLVENELIKQFTPKYNILLKDDKTFPFLMIDIEADFPRLSKYRGVKKDKNRYFGPFASVMSVNAVVDTLQKVFLLRSCRDVSFKNRQRPCLMYQIKRCSAPCVNKISKDEYKKNVCKAIDFLEGKNTDIQKDLSHAMEEASKKLDFETALAIRDRIRSLSVIQSRQNVEYSGLVSTDVIGVALERNIFAVEVFFIRSGQNCGNAVYFPSQTQDADKKDVLEAFLSEFYTNHQPAKEVLVDEKIDFEFWQRALNTRVVHPKNGNKYKLIQFAKNNAVDAIRRKIAMDGSVKNNLQDFKDKFGLVKVPNRIEVYDNSHNQGSYAIGAMIVATPDGFDKKSYRTFNIKYTANTHDDFAMMKEVLRRRFDKLTIDNKPDVVLIDGGRGQLNAVLKALSGYDLEGIEFIAISKGPERNAGKEFYHMKDKDSFELEYRSSLAFYLQNLRDEAHRFAIGTHRRKRAKSIYKSSIDEVEGIGLKRKADLLKYFGSAKDVAEASMDDLQKVEGISKKTAEKIYNYFHN